MKFGRFEKDARLTVSHLMNPETDLAVGEHQTSLSVKVNVSTLAMLGVFCDHFDQSRYAFGGSILDDYTADLFRSLPENLREMFSQKADLQTTELLIKTGFTPRSEGVLGDFDEDTTWRYQNLAIKEGA